MLKGRLLSFKVLDPEFLKDDLGIFSSVFDPDPDQKHSSPY